MSPSSLFHRKKLRRSVAADGQDEPRKDHPRPTARRRHRRKWLVVALLVLAAIVWAIPLVVAHSPLLGWIVATATGDLNGKATVDSASLGWFSPVRASGFQVHDPQGQLVVDLPKVSGDTSLLKLALNRTQLGTFTLERPTINVVLRPNGSNLEELIAKYLTGPSGEPVAVELKVIDATIHVRDEAGGPSWTIEKFSLFLSMSDQKDGPMRLAAKGIVSEAGREGTLGVRMTMGPENHLELQTTGLGLAQFDALVARFAPQTRLAGRLDAQVDCDWGKTSARAETVPMRVAVKLNLDQFVMASPQLGSDQIRLASLKADCQAGWQSGKLLVEKAAVDSDIGRVSLDGRLELSGADPAQLFESLLRQTFELKAQLDLAPVAAMLPESLHIDQQTRITAGQLNVTLASGPSPQGMVCQGRIETSDLAAVHRGQAIAWQKPVIAAIRIRRSDAGPTVDQFDCQSSFLTLRGAGSRQKLAAFAQFDLDQLVRQLNGFVDLGGLQLSGSGSANLTYGRDLKDRFRVDTDLRIRDFRLSTSGRQPWQEDNLVALISAAGTGDLDRVDRLDSATLDVRTGVERWVARLDEPVTEFRLDGRWALDVEAQGHLEHWVNRARSWNLLADWDAAGTYHAEAKIIGSGTGVELRDARLTLGQLRLVGNGLNLLEPTVQLALNGQYDHAQRNLSLSRVKLDSNTLSLEGDHMVVVMPVDGSLELSGNVAYRGNLARLQSCITPPGTRPAWEAQGQLQGKGQLKQTAGTISGQLDTIVANLLLQSADGKSFREPQTQLMVRGSYDPPSQRLALDEFLLAIGPAGIRASGRADQLGQQTTLELAGQIGYDWQRLAPLLQPYVGESVKIDGQGNRPFSFHGPLDPATAEATAGLDWSGAYLYGLRVGPGEIKMHLAGGLVRCDPIDLAVSEGRVKARPQLRLAPSPTLLEIEPGQLIRRVRINPDMCAQGLQYIAPILAGVATAEGTFSIDLDRCQIRIDDPARSELAGRFTVHSIEVGPGALLRELAVVLNRATAAKLQKESVIQFQLVNGRVHHQGLELVFPELTIRTHGSVGLDQSLSLVAEMPIPPKWLAGQQLLDSALRGQILQVPIRGTLKKPQIDHRKLDEYNRKLIRKATRNILEGELNRQINRLFDP
ncbi:MAG: DUF748 domain-containing protein [Pirellulales bacterium]|nr:DUF748 domain-containing protein [Pirellulales bacterium]